ncbi:MAG: hypothetical protein R6V07_03610 [Armatimonadota bacterium]
MRKPSRAKHVLISPAAGLLLGWLLPKLLGPPIVAYGTSLRDSPRLSDAIVGAGGLLIYIVEAPAMYLGEHLTQSIPAEAAVNALGWMLIGLTVGAFALTIRVRRLLAAGAIGGLLLGWMLPALAQTLSECFRHCWMHEGLLGDIALAGGGLLRAVGVLAELPWRLLAGPSDGVTPVLAMPVSAVLWALIGLGGIAAFASLRRSIFDLRRGPEGEADRDGEPPVG